MSLRPKALDGFRQGFGIEPPGPLHVSRHYPPAEAFTHQNAWWFEIPRKDFEGKGLPDVFLLYEIPECVDSFGCLRVPVALFQSCEHHLCFRKDKNVISLFLSAEPADRLVDKRGSGAIRFAPFELIGPTST
jgi:hypothetical protein